jgi:hypothetical protein
MPPTPTRERSDNPTAGRREPPSKAGRAGGSLAGVPHPRRPSPEVVSLIDRIKELVAEHRRIEMSASTELLERYKREIARLQRRLANAVKRELAH